MIGGHTTSSEPRGTMAGTVSRSFSSAGAFGPGRDLARYLFFDDAVVAAHPLAVKRRRQQFAALAVFVAGKAERRARTECLADGSGPRRRTFDQLGAGVEQFLRQDRIVDDHGVVFVAHINSHLD